MKTKLETLKEAYLADDFKKVFSIASKFPRLGNEKDAIKLANDCFNHPEIYKQMGYDLNDCIQKGIKAISKKYDFAGRFWMGSV